jgi:hypothetical protein
MELLLVRGVDELSQEEQLRYDEWGRLLSQYRKHRRILEETGRNSSPDLDLTIGRLGFVRDFLLASEQSISPEHLQALHERVARLGVSLASAKEAFLSLPELAELSSLPVPITAPEEEPRDEGEMISQVIVDEATRTNGIESAPNTMQEYMPTIGDFSNALMGYSQKVSEIFSHFGLRDIPQLRNLQLVVEDSRKRIGTDIISSPVWKIVLSKYEQDCNLPEFATETPQLEDFMRYVFYHKPEVIESEVAYENIMSQELKQVTRVFRAVEDCIKQVSATRLGNIVQHLNPELKKGLIASLQRAQVGLSNSMFHLRNIFETKPELAKIVTRYSLV